MLYCTSLLMSSKTKHQPVWSGFKHLLSQNEINWKQFFQKWNWVCSGNRVCWQIFLFSSSMSLHWHCMKQSLEIYQFFLFLLPFFVNIYIFFTPDRMWIYFNHLDCWYPCSSHVLFPCNSSCLGHWALEFHMQTLIKGRNVGLLLGSVRWRSLVVFVSAQMHLVVRI